MDFSFNNVASITETRLIFERKDHTKFTNYQIEDLIEFLKFLQKSGVSEYYLDYSCETACSFVFY